MDEPNNENIIEKRKLCHHEKHKLNVSSKKKSKQKFNREILQEKYIRR